jgi:hypothetical protein
MLNASTITHIQKKIIKKSTKKSSNESPRRSRPTCVGTFFCKKVGHSPPVPKSDEAKVTKNRFHFWGLFEDFLVDFFLYGPGVRIGFTCTSVHAQNAEFGRSVFENA